MLKVTKIFKLEFDQHTPNKVLILQLLEENRIHVTQLIQHIYTTGRIFYIANLNSSEYSWFERWLNENNIKHTVS
jgi:hypothetical protein